MLPCSHHCLIHRELRSPICSQQPKTDPKIQNFRVVDMSSLFFSGHIRLTVFLLTLLFLVLHSSSQSDQRQLLLKFKSALSNSKTEVFNTWNNETPLCNFTRIVCNFNKGQRNQPPIATTLRNSCF
ncbi:putative leucine-rich repeat-containing, plant-type [Helianthus anomalus]